MEIESALAGDTVRALQIFLQAIAEPQRFQILSLLRDQGRMNVSQIIAATGMEQTRTSHHLACLRNCGLVETERDGKFVYYTLESQRSTGRILTLMEEHVLSRVDEILACDQV